MSLNNTYRLKYVDVLKGIGIILVVVGHVYSNRSVFSWIYSFHMPLFFFAGGLVYKKRSFFIEIKKRVNSILVPYYCFGIFTLLYWQFFERSFRKSDLGFLESLYGLVTGQYDYLDFNVHLWFLPCFFIVAVFFSIMMNYAGRYCQWIAFGVSVVFALLYTFFELPSMWFGIERAMRYMFFFAFGFLFSSIRLVYRVKKIPIYYCILLSIITLVVSFVLSYFSFNTGLGWYFSALIGIFAVLFFSLILEKITFLSFLGRASLVVLCVHGPIYRILIKLFSIMLKESTESVRSNLFFSCIIVALTLFICILFFFFFDRFMPWIIGKHNHSKTNGQENA